MGPALGLGGGPAPRPPLSDILPVFSRQKCALMEQVAHQTIVMQFILELAKSLKVDPRACFRQFFTKIKVVSWRSRGGVGCGPLRGTSLSLREGWTHVPSDAWPRDQSLLYREGPVVGSQTEFERQGVLTAPTWGKRQSRPLGVPQLSVWKNRATRAEVGSTCGSIQSSSEPC